MGKKLSAWKTKGMNRDLSVSAFNPEFAFENMNLRLATNENNTVLSWVNEKGPAYVRVSITKPGKESDLTGNCIGTAVLNNYLVIFTAGNYQSSGSPDRIYRLNYVEDKNGNKYFEGVRLFCGNLGFSVEHPLETLVSYESEHIQKVYWTDGINQPRMINIAPEYNASGEEVIPSYTSTSFDFVPTLQLDETVSVKKVTGGGGMFAPGVIQYSFTYYNKHGQESNIFYTTPLYYISYADRGASPEDKVDNTFRITVNNLDTNFDYLRIYSIQRTSINSTPICKRIQDIEIVTGMTSASYTDTGMSGDSIDPTELLYKGGSGVHVGTMDQKDNTLFMGDLTVLNTAPPKLTNAEKASILASVNEVRTFYVDIESSDNYVYGNQLTAMNSDDDGTSVSVPCAGFKHEDWYRLGVQFQDEFGRWTDPIFLNDVQVGNTPSSAIVETSGGGGGGEEYDDKDLALSVVFDNQTEKWITINNTIELTVNGSALTVNLDFSNTRQIPRGSYEYIGGLIVGGKSYVGKTISGVTVHDATGAATHHAIVPPALNTLSSILHLECKSTDNPDADPISPTPVDPDKPVHDDVKVSVTIINNSDKTITFSGKVSFIVYKSGSSIRYNGACSGNNYTISAGNSKKYAVRFDASQSPKEGLGATFATEEQRGDYLSNNAYFIGNTGYTCDDFDTSDTFEENKEYTMVILNDTQDWGSGGGGEGSDDEILNKCYLACYTAQGGVLPDASARVNHLPTTDNPGFIIFKLVNNSESCRYLWNGRFELFTEDGTNYTANYREPSNFENGAHYYYWDETNFVMELGTVYTIFVPIKRTYRGNIQEIDLSKRLKMGDNYSGYVIYHSNYSSGEGDYLLHNSEQVPCIKSSSLRTFPSITDYENKTNEITGSDKNRIAIDRVYEVSLTGVTNYVFPIGEDKSDYRAYLAHDSGSEHILDPLRLIEWKDYVPPPP